MQISISRGHVPVERLYLQCRRFVYRSTQTPCFVFNPGLGEAWIRFECNATTRALEGTFFVNENQCQHAAMDPLLVVPESAKGLCRQYDSDLTVIFNWNCQ